MKHSLHQGPGGSAQKRAGWAIFHAMHQGLSSRAELSLGSRAELTLST